MGFNLGGKSSGAKYFFLANDTSIFIPFLFAFLTLVDGIGFWHFGLEHGIGLVLVLGG